MANKLIIVVLLLAVVFGSWFAYYFSDKEVIKRQLTGLAGKLEKEAGETPIQLAFKMRAVKDQLADRCQVLVPEQSFDEALEQDLIIRYLMYRHNSYEVITVVFEELQVDIPAKGEAAAQITVRIDMNEVNQEEAVEESGQVEITLKKGEDNWLLHTVIVPENLVMIE
ncbi:MAG: hypothetical protein JRF04_05915 [Deltaproteobacteria bacterium]|nr:hypothetical protein [Deltaproteobacteria bacterium]